MKVTSDMIEVLIEVLDTLQEQLLNESEPEDFESKDDLLSCTLNNIAADFNEYKF